jgi:HUS1 checkpoint protein
MSMHNSVILLQDIPVEILTAAQIASYVEPNLPDPEVYICLPSLKSVKNVIESMKNISDYVTISANMDGELTLSVEASLVSARTYFTKLEHPNKGLGSTTPIDPKLEATAKVDIKKFSRFLYSHVIQPTDVICLFVKDRVLVLLVVCKEELHITYYLPVILS